MFGDSGHGMLMALFGLYLVIAENSIQKKRIDNEIFNIFFAGRYIILLIGCFSMYTGFIYNDIFSKSINIFGTTWSVNYTEDTVIHNAVLTLNPTTDFTQYPYFIGMDPAWQLAKNKIIFLNSYKMKLSIIFGVIHMIFGVCLSVANFV